MRRASIALALAVVLGSCADDRVTLERGPLGPASYEVTVTAGNDQTDEREEHRATLRVDPRSEGANFSLRTAAGGLLTAELSIRDNGSVDLTRVRGTTVEGSGQTELASLVGQLNPPLPKGPVRLGERWASTQRIRTKALSASFSTELRVVRFRRMAETDAAELAGDVGGRLRVSDGGRVLEGRLTGQTTIVWAVEAGRVVAADTELVWALSDGTTVNLATGVEPK